MTPELCPNCGAEVPPRAKACPECGADEKTGWSKQSRYDSLGLPDESFDYNEFVQREFGTKPKHRIHGIKGVWQIVAALLVLGFLCFLFRSWF